MGYGKTTSGKIFKILPRNALVLIGYFFLALIFTWPLVLYWQDKAVGSGDANYVIWQNWWFKKALFDLRQNPLSWNDFLFYPDGYKLGNGYDGLIFPLFSLVFPPGFSPILLYNLSVLISFALNGFAAFLLARQLTKSGLASFFGGLAFGFSPYLLSRGWAGHANLLSAWTIPLFLTLFFQWEKNGSLKNTVRAALGLTLVALSSWQYLFITLFLIAAVFVFRLRIGRQKMPTKSFLLFFGLSIILIFPLALPLIKGVLNNETTKPSLGEYLMGSANLLSYVVPPPLATFGGFLGQKVYPHLPRFNDPEAVLFPGYLEIGLLLYFLYRRWRKKELPTEIPLWLFLSVVFFVLSLGPTLIVINQPVLPLPYLAFLPVPFLNLIRVPARFTVVFSLGLALVLSFWVKEKMNAGRKRRAVFLLMILGLLLVERGFWPFKLTGETASEFYQQISRDGYNYASANLPLWDANNNAPNLYAQTIHQKKIVGGYVAPRAINQNALAFINSHPFFYLSHCQGFTEETAQKITDKDPLPKLLKILKESNVRYLIVHRTILSDALCRRYQEFLNDYFDPLLPYFEDEEIRVYRTDPGF